MAYNADKFRFDINMEFGGMKIKLSVATNGKVAWEQSGPQLASGTGVAQATPLALSCATDSEIRRAASINCSSVVSGPKLKRIAEHKTSSGTRIACRTGDGNSEPLEQAEPVEQAMPARSSFMSNTSARQPGNEMLRM